MGVCFLYGNGGSGEKDRLKLRVLGGMTAPSSPRENDIWVKIASTSFEWAILASGASAQNRAGRVLIRMGTGNTNEFQALIDVTPTNQLWISPVGCVVGDGSTWKNLDAYLYKNGAWVQFSSAWDGHLFNYGNTYSSVTGGWVARAIAHTNDQYGPYNAAPSVQNQSNGGVKVYMSDDGKAGIWTTANKISLAGFNTLTFNGNLTDPHGYSRAQLDIWSDFGTYSSENVVACLNATYNAGTYTLDISSLTGSYYIGVRTDFDGYAIVNEIKLS